jgi:hypothetical protein
VLKISHHLLKMTYSTRVHEGIQPHRHGSRRLSLANFDHGILPFCNTNQLHNHMAR